MRNNQKNYHKCDFKGCTSRGCDDGIKFQCVPLVSKEMSNRTKKENFLRLQWHIKKKFDNNVLPTSDVILTYKKDMYVFVINMRLKKLRRM